MQGCIRASWWFALRTATLLVSFLIAFSIQACPWAQNSCSWRGATQGIAAMQRSEAQPPTFWSVAYLVIPGTYDESLVINLVPYQPTSAMECHRVLDVTRTSLWVMGSISMIWRGTAWLRFHFSSTRALGSSAIKVLGGNCFRTLHGSRGQIRLELPKGSMEGSTKVAPRLY